MNTLALSLASSRLASICEEMGGILRRSALSPNIKDREDYSCALFNRQGELVAQAAHIPVHLGSMVYAMRDIATRFQWHAGDVLIFNDPFLGGTHLPDITLVMPVFSGARLVAFSVSRAHHADIGGKTPGSMGMHQHLQDEGCIIAPQFWFRDGDENHVLSARFHDEMRSPEERFGDLQAQRAACELGSKRLQQWLVADEVDPLFEEVSKNWTVFE